MSYDESWVIRQLTAPFIQAGLYDADFEYQNDAARLPFDDSQVLLVSQDMLVEGVDFASPYFSPQDIAYKALSVNLSDMAAMGATPIGFVQAIAAARDTPKSFWQAYAAGLLECAQTYQVPLLGGDLSSTLGPLVIAITVWGQVPKTGKSIGLTRRQTQVGDFLYVSRPLGDAAAGLDLMRSLKMQMRDCDIDNYERLIQAQKRPVPELKLGRLLLAQGDCHSAMDLSDGLASDLSRLLAKGQGACIDAASIPLSDALLQYTHHHHPHALDFALRGGEDFALLWAMSPMHELKLKNIFMPYGFSMYKIGYVVNTEGIKIITLNGRQQDLQNGFDHFDISAK